MYKFMRLNYRVSSFISSRRWGNIRNQPNAFCNWIQIRVNEQTPLYFLNICCFTEYFFLKEMILLIDICQKNINKDNVLTFKKFISKSSLLLHWLKGPVLYLSHSKVLKYKHLDCL